MCVGKSPDVLLHFMSQKCCFLAEVQGLRHLPPWEDVQMFIIVYCYLGVSENSVPLNPMVNDHYPY